MQTRLSEAYKDTPRGRDADAILRTCVHCGFCTATCPTYQLLSDELDGPRGRIYQIKDLLEGQPITAATRTHLDRCLTCRACETTCPSGVEYGRLVDFGRELVEQQLPRPPLERLKRYGLRKILPYPRRIGALLSLGRLFRPLMPPSLKQKVSPRQQTLPSAGPTGLGRTMLVLEGCAQSVATPRTNAAARRLLARLGIDLIAALEAGCCGAVSQHLAAPEEAKTFLRRNIDAWWPHIEQGAEAIVVTASGCGVMVKDYGHLLRDDPNYADKAHRVAELAKDISEVLRDLPLPRDQFQPNLPRVAFHSPCTLQHGQQLNGVVEGILRRAGFTLTPVDDAHLCCGSAGTYSILQPELSQRLLTDKLAALQGPGPEIIATANIGCQLHLASRAERPVMHWVELLDRYGASR